MHYKLVYTICPGKSILTTDALAVWGKCGMMGENQRRGGRDMADQRPLVVVVDGHGGGMGKTLVARLRERLPQVHVRAVGTNSAATEAMLKGGAEDGATGENAVIFNVGKADFVVGSVAIVMANGLMGEISPRMAQAVGESDAIKVLIPANRCGIRMAVGEELPLRRYLDSCVDLIAAELDG